MSARHTPQERTSTDEDSWTNRVNGWKKYRDTDGVVKSDTYDSIVGYQGFSESAYTNGRIIWSATGDPGISSYVFDLGELGTLGVPTEFTVTPTAAIDNPFTAEDGWYMVPESGDSGGGSLLILDLSGLFTQNLAQPPTVEDVQANQTENEIPAPPSPYDNTFEWLVGEATRAIVGDEALINATDTGLFLGTAAFATTVTLGGVFLYCNPAIALNMAMGAGGGAFWGGVAGGTLGGLTEIASQLDNPNMQGLDLGSVGDEILNGGIMGAATGAAFGAASGVPIVQNVVCSVAPILVGAAAGRSLDDAWENYQKQRYYSSALNVGTAVFDVYSYASGMLKRMFGVGCFVADTQVVLYPRDVSVIDATGHAVALDGDASAGPSLVYASLAGILTLSAAVGRAEDERKRRMAEEEAELARRKLFGGGSDDDPSEDLPRSPFDDDSISWKPDPAADTCDWLTGSDSPGASRRAVDALCEMLFHAEDRRTPRRIRPTSSPCHTHDAADSGASPPLSDRFTIPPEADETPNVQPNTPTEYQEMAWGVSPGNIGDNKIPKAPTGRHEDAGGRSTSGKSSRQRRSFFTRLWPIAALLLAGFCGWMAFTSAGPERDVREIAAAQNAQTTQSDASDRYVTAKIQDIREGDYVLATDPETGEQAPRRVVDAFSRVVNKLRILEVRTESGRIETIRTTDEHPFWVDETEDFLPAGDLEPGDSFHGPTGEKTTLVSTRSEDHPEGVVVYNFEVEGSHTYFVLTQGEDGLTGAGVLVHNASGGSCGKFKAGNPGKEGPNHHIATHYDNAGRGDWGSKFKRLFRSCNRGIHGQANKIRLKGHQGPHSEAYHKAVYRELRNAVKGLRGKARGEALEAKLHEIANKLRDDITILDTGML